MGNAIRFLPTTLIVITTAVLLNLMSCDTAGVGSGAGNPPFGTRYCDEPGADPNGLCAFIPHDVDDPIALSNGYRTKLDTTNQPRFDQFSWQSFVALNWPADSAGQPTGSIIGNNDDARVWEYYTSVDDVFGGGPDTCDPNTPGSKILFHPVVVASGDFTTAGFTENDGNALIDRNLNFALYEIKMSDAEVDYTERHKLNTLSGQMAFVDSLKLKGKPLSIDLPASYYKIDSTREGGEIGTIEIKAAWRLLMPSEKDRWDRFYHRPANIYIPGSNRQSGRDTCFVAEVGLIGMHIITKTKQFPIMIWSTFEHVDNTPDNINDAALDPSYPWSFYNPMCINCLVNTPADTAVGNQNTLVWADTPPFAQAYGQTFVNGDHVDTFGSQVTRTFPIYGPTQQMNTAWQSKLSGSVFQYYRLIGSQWLSTHNEPIHGIPQPPPAPPMLGNTVIETFMQGNSSCIGCHNGATTNDTAIWHGDSLRYDFSFLFFRGLANK